MDKQTLPLDEVCFEAKPSLVSGKSSFSSCKNHAWFSQKALLVDEKTFLGIQNCDLRLR